MKALRVFAAAVGINSPTERIVSFKLKDENGARVTDKVNLEMIVFGTEALIAPAEDAVITSAIRGTIRDGVGLAAAQVTTADDGWITCIINKSAPGTVWVLCSNAYGAPVVEHSDIVAVTFPPID
jgi:hypothetical protein